MRANAPFHVSAPGVAGRTRAGAAAATARVDSRKEGRKEGKFNLAPDRSRELISAAAAPAAAAAADAAHSGLVLREERCERHFLPPPPSLGTC